MLSLLWTEARAVLLDSYTEKRRPGWSPLLRADSRAHTHSPSLNYEHPCKMILQIKINTA